jgi:hypothetical protein
MRRRSRIDTRPGASVNLRERFARISTSRDPGPGDARRARTLLIFIFSF